jgi:hypothetical protein
VVRALAPVQPFAPRPPVFEDVAGALVVRVVHLGALIYPPAVLDLAALGADLHHTHAGGVGGRIQLPRQPFPSVPPSIPIAIRGRLR